MMGPTNPLAVGLNSGAKLVRRQRNIGPSLTPVRTAEPFGGTTKGFRPTLLGQTGRSAAHTIWVQLFYVALVSPRF